MPKDKGLIEGLIPAGLYFGLLLVVLGLSSSFYLLRSIGLLLLSISIILDAYYGYHRGTIVLLGTFATLKDGKKTLRFFLLMKIIFGASLLIFSFFNFFG